MADLPSLQPMSASVQRPPSIRSVASNSSIASGASLTRRPRTRTRSKTVTGASPRPEDIFFTSASELPYVDAFVQEPEDIAAFLAPLNIPPIRPPRSPQRLEPELHNAGTPSSQELELAAAEVTFVEPPHPSPMTEKMSKAARIASNLPVIETGYRPPPSAFSRDPALTPVINVRDSVSTQQSGTSSSLYPPSTSTASAPESPPSPRSMSEQFDQLDVPTFGHEVNAVQEYDGDDVAYRLRLLVKNNYFLPPAHSKPSPSDFASAHANTKKQTKTSTPAFLDLFRVGKPKPKPTTPTGSPNFDPMLPMLRTTADSITPSYALRPQQPRVSSQLPRTSPQLPTRGRVVVVREKMNDISVAAKQAEQELKSRGVLNQGSQKEKVEVFDDVIDPTDAVDLPPPSASYPFAVQASALHGLGVQDSLGAAVLADRLPPPKSPNMSSSYEADEDWRKALLHQAVHHSLDNTPDISTFSHVLGSSTPLSSPHPNKAASRAPSLKSRDMGRKILDQTAMNHIDSSELKHSRQLSGQSQASTSKGPVSNLRMSPHQAHEGQDIRSANYVPIRVNTPCEPLTPLAPPPRRHFVNPLYSLSQTDLTSLAQPAEPLRPSSSASRHTLRKARSSPLLSDHESINRRGFVMTPPPMPNQLPKSRVSSRVTTSSFETVRDHLEGSVGASESHYSDDDSEIIDLPRSSIALSAVNGRPSLSEYSQSSMSPTTSVFQNALNNGPYYSTSSLGHHHPSHLSFEHRRVSAENAAPRNSTMSPPPRISSSLAHVALPPPPRSASFQYPRHFLRPASVASSTEPGSPVSHVHGGATQLGEPEPMTPPFSLSERRGNPNQISLSLDIPRHPIPVAIHSAPGPSSPTSFFDNIQTQPNAMDDLESSSDESEDEVEESTPPPQTSLFVDPRTRAISSVSATSPRPQIMKLGNHSTPYVGRPMESFRQTLLPISGGSTSLKKPVANVPSRAPFFTDRKSDSGHTLPSSTYDFYKYAQERPPANANALAPTIGSRKLSPTEQVALWRNNQRAQESLRKLDGMLIQHMEAEKDTIKRIATTMKQTNSIPDPSIPS